MSAADFAVDGEGVRAIAGRIDALALVLTAALESPRRYEALDAAAKVLTFIRLEAQRVHEHAAGAVVVCEVPGV